MTRSAVASKIRELCSIDFRSLALFRIGVALIILWDLAVRGQHLTAHYTDLGVLPRDLLISRYFDFWHFSLHLINGTTTFNFVLFIVAGAFALAMLAGYRTRAATIASWVLLISLHSRNPLVLQGGDIMLRLLLFWGMFLPLGARWSIDAYLNDNNAKRETDYCSAASIALLLQVCFVYWFTALLKTDDTWRVDGSAVWYALSGELFSSAFGLSLLEYTSLLKFLTFSTLYLEAFGPFFAFSPIFSAPLRTATAIAFLFFHLIALNLTMDIGHFIYVCGAAWIVFIPGWFWNKAAGMEYNPASSWSSGKAVNSLATGCLVYIFLWNVRSVGVDVPALSTSPLNIAGPMLRIDQLWNMFSPFPLRDDGWFVIPAKLRDGSEIDLYTDGAPISWKKPPLIAASYANDRWKSYLIGLYLSEDAEVELSAFARFLAFNWNSKHPDEKQLERFKIIFMTKTNTIGKPPPEPRKAVLWTQYFTPPSEETLATESK